MSFLVKSDTWGERVYLRIREKLALVHDPAMATTFPNMIKAAMAQGRASKCIMREFEIIEKGSTNGKGART